VNTDPDWQIVTEALCNPVTKSAAAPQHPEGEWGMVKQALAAAAKGAYGLSRAAGGSVAGSAMRAGRAVGQNVLGNGKQLIKSHPGAARMVGAGLAGAGIYTGGHARGHAKGREAGMGEGYDAGLQQGVTATNALNQEGDDVLGRLKALFAGRPSYDTQAIIDSLQGNRANVINQLLGQSA
jgi:hypothetical protein